MRPEHLCMGCMEDKGDAEVCPECRWKEGTLPESAVQLPPRTVLNNQYLLGRVLGQGGFGITYLAWDMSIQRKVAVKEYFPHGFANRSQDRLTVSVYSDKNKEDFSYGLSKFLEEARSLAKFQDHPGIVSVLTFFEANGTGYLVMEYVEGMTFKAYLEQEGGKIPFKTAYKILVPVMDALREIHNSGLLHRDISPDNIYISEKGRIKLLDFGAARFAMGEHSKSLSVILKDGYAPEEQYRTKGEQGPWTDVYALGATLYRAITGVVPPQALDRLAEDDLQSPGELGMVIPSTVESALIKSLAVRFKDRYQGIKEFQDALEQERGDGADRKPDEAAFTFARKMGTKEAFEAYLDKFPHGVHAEEANKILNDMKRAEIENREKEAEVFEMAKKIDTVKAYNVFLEDFPDGNYAQLARNRITELSGKGRPLIEEKQPVKKEPGFLSKVLKKFNIGALWMVLSMVSPFLMALIIQAFDSSDSSVNMGAIIAMILCFGWGVKLAFSRKKIMNGEELACYWIGFSYLLTFMLGLLFPGKLAPITIALAISIISGISLIIKRKDIASGTEISLYWFGFSGALTGFLAALFYAGDFADGGARGALIGTIISIISGVIVIIKKRKALSGKEIFIYWLGLSAAFIGFLAAFFDLAEFSWVPGYDDGGYGAIIGLLTSLITGAFILIKRRKGSRLA